MSQSRLSVVIVLALVASIAAAGAAAAAVSTDSTNLRNAVEVGEIMEHQREFQRIADENDDNRASGTAGFDARPSSGSLRAHASISGATITR